MAVKLPDQSSTTVRSITSAERAEPALGTRAATATASTVDDEGRRGRHPAGCSGPRPRRPTASAAGVELPQEPTRRGGAPGVAQQLAELVLVDRVQAHEHR